MNPSIHLSPFIYPFIDPSYSIILFAPVMVYILSYFSLCRLFMIISQASHSPYSNVAWYSASSF